MNPKTRTNLIEGFISILLFYFSHSSYSLRQNSACLIEALNGITGLSVSPFSMHSLKC